MPTGSGRLLRSTRPPESERREAFERFGVDARLEFLLLAPEPMRPLRGGRGRGAAADVAFELGSRVRHEEWGDGAVQRYDGDTMVGLFDDVGYKTLGAELVLDNELLVPAG